MSTPGGFGGSGFSKEVEAVVGAFVTAHQLGFRVDERDYWANLAKAGLVFFEDVPMPDFDIPHPDDEPPEEEVDDGDA